MRRGPKLFRGVRQVDQYAEEDAVIDRDTKSIGDDIKANVLGSMNVLEKAAAWMILRWLKREAGGLIMKRLKNWETTIAGLVIAGITVALSMGWITSEQSAMLIGAATAAGLFAAKDGKTGSAPGMGE